MIPEVAFVDKKDRLSPITSPRKCLARLFDQAEYHQRRSLVYGRRIGRILSRARVVLRGNKLRQWHMRY